MRTYLSITSILAICYFLFSCDSTPQKHADDYKTEAVQTVEIGDTVRIYYTTNSCCGYCSPSKESLNHLGFLGEEIIIPYPDDCDGCDRTKALLFLAKSSGTDTILGKVSSHSLDCSDSLIDFKSYIIHVQ